MLTYSNLSTRSHYSCGMGIGTSKEFITQAKKLGLSGIAITERFTAAGLLDFYFTSKKMEYPVALGVEIYYFDGMGKTNKLIILARNQNGYHSLCKLVTASWNNAETYKMPCVSLFDLKENTDGVYCFCPDFKKIKELKPIFNQDNFFMEIVLGGNPENNHAIFNSTEKFVISNEAYMPTIEHKQLQDIMIVNNSRGYSTEVMPFAKYMKSAKEVIETIIKEHSYLVGAEKIAQAFQLSNKLIDECSKITLKFKDQVVNYPHLMHPLNYDGCSKHDLTWRIIKEYERLPDDQLYVDRMEYEINAIQNNGRIDLLDYFLVLEDLCRFCRENNIAVGPGRGSGAGSLLNYCLKVTHLDPIQEKLLFERFISEGRIQKGTMPDVDLDFSDPERVRVYLREMYGDDRVIRIGTFQTLKVLGSIKDIMKADHPELDFQVVNRITGSFGKKDQEETELEFWQRNIEENDVAINFFKQFPLSKDKVERLLGYNRQAGGHPCGLAITQDPIIQFAPLRKNKDEWYLELTAGDCERAGILKYDILGLKTMKYIQTCMELSGIDDLYSLPLDDLKTFEAFFKGDTTSVFQFNSDVSKNILTQLPLESYSGDILCMTTAAGRPGPMKNGIHIDFIRRVQGKTRPTPPHPALEAELRETYGLMIYQESVMKAAQILGGFNLAEADDIRKAMGKKIASVLAPYKDRFVQHCQLNHPETKEKYISEDVNAPSQTIAEHIWNLMATFSGYGFNKSHSMAYARIGYYCQYFKVNHPLQWWTACMMHADSDQLKDYYMECAELTLNPDINNATSEFYINDEGKIQMPFSCLKGLGPKASEEIVVCRPFSSFEDFFTRVNKTRVNKSVVERLIFSGCFDRFSTNLQELVDQYYKLRGEKVPDDMKVLTKSKIAEMRSKSLSFLSMDYYKIYPHLFPENEVVYFNNITTSANRVTIGGIITEVKLKKTSGGKEMGDIMLQNDGDDIKIRIWSENIELYRNSLEKKKIVKVTCSTGEYMGKLQLTAVNIQAL